MIRVMLACDSARLGFGMQCPTFEPPAHTKFEETAGWIAATLEEHGWTILGDEHFCPRHDPALKGEVVTVTTEYAELVPGIEVRLPDGSFPGETSRIEVRVVERECHGNVGAVCGGGTGPYGKQPQERPYSPSDVSPIAEARNRLLERLEPIARQQLLDYDPDALLEQTAPGSTRPAQPLPNGMLALAQLRSIDPQPVEPREHVINRDVEG